MDEKILTPDQVALILQVHPFTVLKFIKQGKLRASKLGRVYRIRQSDVGRFLDEGEATVKEADAHASKAKPRKTSQSASSHAIAPAPSPTAHAHKGSTQGDQPLKEAETNLPDSEISDFAHSESKIQPAKTEQSHTEHVDHYILD